MIEYPCSWTFLMKNPVFKSLLISQILLSDFVAKQVNFKALPAKKYKNGYKNGYNNYKTQRYKAYDSFN